MGATNSNSSLTDYSSSGGYNKYNHVIKPDIVAPGGMRNDWSFLKNLTANTPIYAADSNNGEYISHNFSSGFEDILDVVANDTRGVSGTSFATPFVAGVSQLIIEALGGRNNWNYSENEALFVKNLMLLTASETYPNYRLNIIDQNLTEYSPTLDRGDKDVHEGYGKLNPDTAIDAILNEMLVNSTQSSYLYSIPTNNEFKPYAWARKIYLPRNFYNISLDVPQTADFDLYIYDYQGDQYGEPIILQKGINVTLGGDEIMIDFAPPSDGYYFVVVKGVNGSGQFNLSFYKSPTYFDKIPPNVKLLLPLNNSYLNKTILISGHATDDYSLIKNVRFVIITPTRQLTFDLSYPSTEFNITWISRKTDNGVCSIYIIASDELDNLAYSLIHNITIFNDNIEPIIQWISPLDLSTITGTFLISAYITDEHSEITSAKVIINTPQRNYESIKYISAGLFEYYFTPSLDDDGTSFVRIEALDSEENLSKSETLLLIFRAGLFHNNGILYSLILAIGGMIGMNIVFKRIIIKEKYFKLLENLQDFIRKPSKTTYSKINLKTLIEKEDYYASRINQINLLIMKDKHLEALTICNQIIKREIRKSRKRVNDEIIVLLEEIKRELMNKIRRRK